MFRKVLIANRGEIAVRVARACRELNLAVVGVHSTADDVEALRRHVDETVCIGPGPAGRSYRNAAALVEAARRTGADAVHPGYGFLSEDPDFAEICAANDLVFIGAPAQVMACLGDKSTARTLMREAGLPLLPGSREVPGDVDEAARLAATVGYPVIIKAAAGGGGNGMTVVREPGGFARAFAETRAVARAVFGDDRVYVERYLERARHVEVQVLVDEQGTGIHLGTRECSVQRRHQKLLEEAPAPGLDPQQAAAIARDAVHGALATGFRGAGTVEFLVDADGRHYFMEINCRIQVEHPATEMVTGCDIVREQVRVAAGLPLGLTQQDVQIRGTALECRVNVEDPANDFRPTPGRIERFLPPGGPFTRVDTHAWPGYVVGPHYDSLLAKVIVWAPRRDEAIARADRALAEFEVAGPGVRTTIPFLRRVLADEEFASGRYATSLVDRLLAGTPPEPGRRR
ncbi:ATP-binding protein [Frankia sp. CiP1_Cm_nod1]|uniref:ATP-binding protein n=1 Tax=Frankia sp. CiP1_Cm_nod1 TaxID=2897160 RepID=UPI002025722A